MVLRILQSFRELLNRVVDFARWPLVVVMVMGLWFVGPIVWRAIAQLAKRDGWALPFVIGAIVYAVLWYSTGRRSKTLAWLMTLEHELTHALMAILTLNGIHSLKSHSTLGGLVEISGRSNWMVLVAPYVLPTVLLPLSVQIAWAPPSWRAFVLCLIGLAFAFHVHSSFLETHRRQTDLQELGWTFVALFVPTAHLWALLWFSGVLLGHQRHLTAAWVETIHFPFRAITKLLGN